MTEPASAAPEPTYGRCSNIDCADPLHSFCGGPAPGSDSALAEFDRVRAEGDTRSIGYVTDGFVDGDGREWVCVDWCTHKQSVPREELELTARPALCSARPVVAAVSPTKEQIMDTLAMVYATEVSPTNASTQTIHMWAVYADAVLALYAQATEKP